jgi:hypothetical protein
MNAEFFKRNYSEDLTDKYRHTIQKDGYAYATSIISNDTLLLVIDDISNNRDNYSKRGGSRLYDGVDCVNFLDNGIMTKHTYNIGKDICYLLSFGGSYEFYNKDRFDLDIKEINRQEEITSLRKVLYYLQPTLQGRTLAGGGEANTATDPNYYEGRYYLRNGEEYTILKHGDTVEFYNMKKPYTYLFSPESERCDCIHREKIDFDLYSKAIKLRELKRQITYATGEMVEFHHEELISMINDYKKLKKELNEKAY